MQKKKKKSAKATKTSAAAPKGKVPKADKPRSKGAVVTGIAEATGLNRKQVSGLIESLNSMITQDLAKSGPQKFTLPGLAKFTVVRKPATKARKGINPFTGEEMMFKPKPARNVVRIRPLKALKDKV